MRAVIEVVEHRTPPPQPIPSSTQIHKTTRTHVIQVELLALSNLMGPTALLKRAPTARHLQRCVLTSPLSSCLIALYLWRQMELVSL
jgi:hypothetical protein